MKKSEEIVREKRSNALPVIAATGLVARNRGSLFGGSSSSGASSRQIGSAATEEASFGSRPFAIAAEPPDSMVIQYGMLKELLNGMFDGFSDPQYTTVYNAGISINQPIFTFGKIGTAIQVAKHFNESSRSTYTRNLQLLQLQAIDGFYRAILASQAENAAGHSLARKKDLNEFLERNFQLGSGSKAQVLMTRADVYNQTSATLIAHRDAQTARMFLNALLGRPLTDSSTLDTTGIPEDLTGAPVPPAGDAVKTALANRADVRSLSLLAQSTRGGAKIYDAMKYPTIAATGSAGYSKYESNSKLFQIKPMPNWTIGVFASWTLFDGFANSARAAQFRSDADKLQIAGKTVEKMIEIETRSAIEECHAADSNMTAATEMLKAAQESYDLTNSNFKEGSGQLADLQRVDEMLQLAELGIMNARYRQVRSRAALIVATGKDIVSIQEEDL